MNDLNQLVASGQYLEAKPHLETILAKEPRNIVALHLYSIVAFEFGEYALAIKLAEKALKLKPDFLEVLINIGGFYKHSGEFGKAIFTLKKALKLKPNEPNALSNIGAALIDIGDFISAEYYLNKALKLGNPFPEVYSNLGSAVKNKDPYLAMDYFNQALKLNPNKPTFKYNLATTKLLVGNYKEGFPESFVRFDLGYVPKLLPDPIWDGKYVDTLFVWAEQGYGDTLQFCRFLPYLNAKNIIFTCPAPLVKLLKNSFPTITIISEGIPKHDAHCPLMSIPGIIGTTLDNIPNQPYLKADTVKLNGKFKIGLVWKGSKRPDGILSEIDNRRSMDITQFRPILKLPFEFYSLQKDVKTNLLKEYPLNDFYDTACLINGLDMVIAVDTAVAHLSAGLGKPTLLLSRYDQCWRWLFGKTDSPWYPTMKIFQQKFQGNWEDPIKDVVNHLNNLVK